VRPFRPFSFKSELVCLVRRQRVGRQLAAGHVCMKSDGGFVRKAAFARDLQKLIVRHISILGGEVDRNAHPNKDTPLKSPFRHSSPESQNAHGGYSGKALTQSSQRRAQSSPRDLCETLPTSRTLRERF